MKINSKIFNVLFLFFFLFSCKTDTKREEEFNKSNGELNIDSLRVDVHARYGLIPKNLQELKKYKEYSKIIDNLIIIKSNSNDFYKKQILKTSLFKVYYLSGEFDLALKQIKSIPDKEEYINLKEIYIGVLYFLRDKNETSKKYFNNVYSRMKNEVINDRNCFHYSIVAKLADKKIPKSPCTISELNQKVNRIKTESKEDIILNYFFKEIEL